MKIATIILEKEEVAAIGTDYGYLPIKLINEKFNKNWPPKLFDIINNQILNEIKDWYDNNITMINEITGINVLKDNAMFAPLYRRPRKIWGIGLNYKAHADDLSEKIPTSEPASFMKPDTAIVGYGDTIKIPELSHKTTGEAELGIIFGKECRDISRDNWHTVVAGFTTIIDMTAEDILRRNPRNLTQSKSFDTFFSFGPIFYTLDEVEDLYNVKVQTIKNGKVHAENSVSNMTFPIDYLVSYHSKIMTMLPGDIISTGTPGAVQLNHGDIIECNIVGFQPLVNNVIDLKCEKEK